MSLQDFEFEIVHKKPELCGKCPVGDLNKYFKTEWAGTPITGMSNNFHDNIRDAICALLTEDITITDTTDGIIQAYVSEDRIIGNDRWSHPLTIEKFNRCIPHAHDMYLYMNNFSSELPDEFMYFGHYNKSYLMIDISVSKLELSIRICLKPALLGLPNKKSVVCSALKWHAGSISIIHKKFRAFQYIRWSMNFHTHYGDLIMYNLNIPRSQARVVVDAKTIKIFRK